MAGFKASSALGAIEGFVGLGALGGGGMLIGDPTGRSIGLPLEFLAGSVFDSFLVPGLVLFGIIGIGNITGAVLCLKGGSRSGWTGLGLGLILVGWISVQLAVIGYRMWIQPLFFGIGVLEAALGYLVLKRS